MLFNDATDTVERRNRYRPRTMVNTIKLYYSRNIDRIWEVLRRERHYSVQETDAMHEENESAINYAHDIDWDYAIVFWDTMPLGDPRDWDLLMKRVPHSCITPLQSELYNTDDYLICAVPDFYRTRDALNHFGTREVGYLRWNHGIVGNWDQSIKWFWWERKATNKNSGNITKELEAAKSGSTVRREDKTYKRKRREAISEKRLSFTAGGIEWRRKNTKSRRFDRVS